MTQSSTGNANYARSIQNWEQLIQLRHKNNEELALFFLRETRGYSEADAHMIAEDGRNLANMLNAVAAIARRQMPL